MNPRKAQGLAWREVDSHVIVVAAKHGEIHELDPVGSFLWKEATGEVSLDELARRVCVEFEVGETEARRDAGELFATLDDHHLIEWVA